MQESTYVATMRRAAQRVGKRGLIGVGAGMVVLVVLFVVAFRLLAAKPAPPPQNAAEQLAANFYGAVAHQQYTAAYAMLAPQQQAELTAFAFTLFAREQDQQFGMVTAYQEVRYDRDRNAANQGVVQERVTRGQHTRYVIGLTMQQQADGTWKILEENHAI